MSESPRSEVPKLPEWMQNAQSFINMMNGAPGSKIINNNMLDALNVSLPAEKQRYNLQVVRVLATADTHTHVLKACGQVKAYGSEYEGETGDIVSGPKGDRWEAYTEVEFSPD